MLEAQVVYSALAASNHKRDNRDVATSYRCDSTVAQETLKVWQNLNRFRCRRNIRAYLCFSDFASGIEDLWIVCRGNRQNGWANFRTY